MNFNKLDKATRENRQNLRRVAQDPFKLHNGQTAQVFLAADLVLVKVDGVELARAEQSRWTADWIARHVCAQINRWAHQDILDIRRRILYAMGL